MRNVELKARDPDPARSLERALALGAEEQGEIRQRDTYFAGARGRLKLREQERAHADVAGSAVREGTGRMGADAAGPAAREATGYDDELVQYSRNDSTEARTSSYRRIPTGKAAELREALDAAYGTLVTVTKTRRLLIWEGVRIHLDDVEGLGSYLELEAVADADSDLSGERQKVERLRAELGVEDEDLVAASYSDLVLSAPDQLLRAAEEVMRTAYVPYSHFPVGAALRAPDGGIHVGSNVENASYPQGQCAETSAIGALIAAGQTQIAEVAVTAERMDICPPCGGCRQRLAEFASADTPVHLGRSGGPRKTTTVGELLPLAFELEPRG